jgi:prophage regulatory protein
MSAILRLPTVLVRTGISRSTLYLLMSRDEFPRSIPLGIRSVGWTSDSIEAWIEGRIALSRTKKAEGTSPAVHGDGDTSAAPANESRRTSRFGSPALHLRPGFAVARSQS